MAVQSRFLACPASTSLFDGHRRYAVVASPGSSFLSVWPYFQSVQLPPTCDGRWWVKRFGPGDPPSPAALLSALQVYRLIPNCQTSVVTSLTSSVLTFLSCVINEKVTVQHFTSTLLLRISVLHVFSVAPPTLFTGIRWPLFPHTIP